ncbi:MAG: hypothetical protein ACLP5E_02120 [Streptosporangiaceae bacterium]
MPGDRDKWLSIGHLRRRDRVSVVESGGAHPESGLPYQVTRDELGNDVTEHGKPGSGVSARQDVLIRAETIRGLES